MRTNKNRDISYTLLLLGLLVLLVVILSLSSSFFFSWKNGRNVLNQSAIYLLLSIGMTFMISAGQIDLSVGSILGFTGMTMGLLIQGGTGTAAAVAIGLLTAFAIGLVNGLLVSYGRINSFIVTLSTMTILRGIILIKTNAKSIFGFGDAFTFIGSGSVGPVNLPIVISILAAAAGAVILHRTRFGSYCLFIGSNEMALNRSGVSVRKYKTLIFALCGLCAGAAGMIVTSRINSAEPLAGQGYEMDAIAITILGGTDLKGGKGSVIGTVIACFILNVMKNGLTLLSISSHYQEILTGVILLIAVSVSESGQRKKREV